MIPWALWVSPEQVYDFLSPGFPVNYVPFKPSQPFLRSEERVQVKSQTGIDFLRLNVDGIKKIGLPAAVKTNERELYT